MNFPPVCAICQPDGKRSLRRKMRRSERSGVVVIDELQVQQQLQVEIVEPFSPADLPLLNLNFTHSGQNVTHQMKIPVYPNKFFEKTSMSADVFFNRWKAFESSAQEHQVVFKATQVFMSI